MRPAVGTAIGTNFGTLEHGTKYTVDSQPILPHMIFGHVSAPSHLSPRKGRPKHERTHTHEQQRPHAHTTGHAQTHTGTQAPRGKPNKGYTHPRKGAVSATIRATPANQGITSTLPSSVGAENAAGGDARDEATAPQGSSPSSPPPQVLHSLSQVAAFTREPDKERRRRAIDPDTN